MNEVPLRYDENYLVFIDPKCKKCGKMSGFFGVTPTYVSIEIGSALQEWLEWSCVRCGYTVKTKVADA